MASRFGSHLKVWFFFVPLLAIVVMPAIPDRALFQIPAAETQSLTDSLGAERADELTRAANQAFRNAFVNNGVLHRTLVATQDSSGISDGGASTFAYTWTRNFWLLIYRMIYRAMVMKVWLTGTVCFAVAMFVDGTMRRKIKASAAGYASPLSFHLAGHGLLLVGGTLFGVLVVPVPVLGFYWLAVGAVLGLLLWKAAESFQAAG
jgi:hypothetical protein